MTRDRRFDPREEYPWNVEVDDQAKGTLYLIGTYPLKYLFLDPIDDLFEYMKDRLSDLTAAAADDIIATRILRTTRSHPRALFAAIETARLAIANAPTAGGFPKTYAEFAQRAADSWDADPANRLIKQAFEGLAAHISVPLLRSHRTYSAALFGQFAAHIDDFGSIRSVKDLFTKPHTAINGTKDGVSELAVWRQAKKAGVLWCKPLYAAMSDADRKAAAQYPIHGNGWYCNPTTHKCTQRNPPNPDDYCQEIDGVCNAMSG